MQADRAPLQTYEQAIWRLVQAVVSERFDAAQIDLSVDIVADIFWVADKKVLEDVAKASSGLGLRSAEAPAPRSHIRGYA
ncbi:hypothetical protein CCR90_18230 [Rhodovulum sulfidophilum]|uniref:hypothetical protein n=1 Tax=Rhodovulum sulfidophilum TaxID=35806 RepID=UPI0019143B97|nr:hypothetical protein [Rhodovulum sulfidophilum]MBK5925661.1 hypothetical protein [Rhodovulum sulfidophilum]